MLRLKIFIIFVLFSGVTIGALDQSSTEQEVYWTCTSVDKANNIFSGWNASLTKAKEAALDNCSTYSETGEACVASADPCEKMELSNLHAAN